MDNAGGTVTSGASPSNTTNAVANFVEPEAATEYARFEDLATRLVQVPKSELDDERAKP